MDSPQQQNKLPEPDDINGFPTPDARQLLAFQVAEDAKKHVITWAKWMIGVAAAILAILGFQFGAFLSQLDTKITNLVDSRVEEIVKRKSDDIDRRAQQMVDRQFDAQVKTSVEMSNALSEMKRDSTRHFETLQERADTLLDEFAAAASEVRKEKEVTIAFFRRQQIIDPPTSSGIDISLIGRSRSSGRSDIFGDFPANVIGVSGIGSGENLFEGTINGRPGSPFAYFLFKSLQDRRADSDNNNSVTLSEAIRYSTDELNKQWTLQGNKDLGIFKQTPFVTAYGESFAFIQFDGALIQRGFPGKLKTLVIAIDRYKTNASVSLRGCVNDGRDFLRFLAQNSLADSVDTLFDEEATAEAILASIGKLVDSADDGDVVVLFYSGHLFDMKQGDPQEYINGIAPTDLVEKSALQFPEIAKLLASSKARDIVVIVP